MIQKDKSIFMGIVKKRLYDTKKLAVYNSAREAGLDQEYLDSLLKLASKKLFQGNYIWKLFNMALGKDIRNIFTGKYVFETVNKNLITTRGKQVLIDQACGFTTTPANVLAIGSGTTSPVAGNTALQTEITADGGTRGTVTPVRRTTNTTNDTFELSKTFTATASINVSEEGIFDDDTTGNLLARNVFPTVPLENTDSLVIVHQIVATV